MGKDLWVCNIYCDEGKSMKNKVVKIIISVVGLLIILGTALWANHYEKPELVSKEGQTYEKAVVKQIVKDNLEEDGNRYGDQTVVLEIKSGELKGKEVEANSPDGNLFGAVCREGMRVIAIVSKSGDQITTTVYSQDRSLAIYGFLLIFVLFICLIGGKKGIKAVVSLAFTVVILICILFPLVYRGYSPFLVTVILCGIATVFTLVVVGGLNAKTLAAITGTVVGVIAAGVSASLFGAAAGISGYNVSEIESLNFVAQNSPLKIGQLLFAGILISSLGAVMDVGMSISSTIQEIHEKNSSLGMKELFMSGIHVGRDMMGTMSNTLILAFVGGSLIDLLLDYAYDLSYNQLINSYNIGIEVMQGIAGSLGVVLTVPVTSYLAALLISHSKKANKDITE